MRCWIKIAMSLGEIVARGQYKLHDCCHALNWNSKYKTPWTLWQFNFVFLCLTSELNASFKFLLTFRFGYKHFHSSPHALFHYFIYCELCYKLLEFFFVNVLGISCKAFWLSLFLKPINLTIFFKTTDYSE